MVKRLIDAWRTSRDQAGPRAGGRRAQTGNGTKRREEAVMLKAPGTGNEGHLDTDRMARTDPGR